MLKRRRIEGQYVYFALKCLMYLCDGEGEWSLGMSQEWGGAGGKYSVMLSPYGPIKFRAALG